MGIVSALGRSGLTGFNQYQDFIQTDAAINPGNSGGALVDAEGRLVGINTAIVPAAIGGNQGIGFAVPINMARHVMERLISGGKVTRGYLGILLQDIMPDWPKRFNLPDQNGALVGDVHPEHACGKGRHQIRRRHHCLQRQGNRRRHSLDLAVSECSPGSPGDGEIAPQRTQRKLSPSPSAELPATMSQSQNDRDQNDSDAGRSMTDALDGVTVQDLEPRLRQQLKVPDEIRGALVTEVDQDSNSAEAGLQHGDVIVEINRQPVNNADDAVKLGRQAKGDQILLKIWRRTGDLAGTRYLSVDNTKKPK